ncbi:PRA1 family protein A1 isoform X1 [Vitis vinifera]|uniref:PRA1 family protein A1 isoform X1 n=1 Tax=Vitis vinifera TaxID=29760 RepID=UPI0028834EC3|nr:PRA1 family protein A1 isoform X1 [Vitis vinifera]
MDWGNVTAEDLIDALREVDWSTPPRPLSEFFSRFTLPRSYSKWSSRLKCNFYYYRTNYFIMIVFILGMGFLRRPIAIVAAFLTALSIAFLNDSFAGTFSEKVTRTVRQFSPHLAAKMRPPLTPVIRGRPSAKRSILICGRPRWVFVLIFSSGIYKNFLIYFFIHCSANQAIFIIYYSNLDLMLTNPFSFFFFPLSVVSFILWFVSCSILTVLWALAIGLLGIFVHSYFLPHFFLLAFRFLILSLSLSLLQPLSSMQALEHRT